MSISKLDQLKDILLKFCSSELSSHASNLVSFAIMLFAFLSVVKEYFGERIVFGLPLCFTEESFRYFIIFFILGFLSSGVFFATMRLVYWGKLSSRIIHYKKVQHTSLDNFWEALKEEWENERFFWMPVKMWSGGIASNPKGLWVSLAIGFIASFILVWTFLFK